jgi:hypothetical protein
LSRNGVLLQATTNCNRFSMLLVPMSISMSFSLTA